MTTVTVIAANNTPACRPIVITAKRSPKPSCTGYCKATSDPFSDTLIQPNNLWWTVQHEDIGGLGERERSSEENKAQEELCNGIDKKVEDTKSALSGFVTNFPGWNDIGNLQFEMNWTKGDLKSLQAMQDIVGIGGPAAGSIAPWFLNIGKGASSILAITNGIAQWNLSNRITSKQNKVKALEARIAQLRAQKASSCSKKVGG